MLCNERSDSLAHDSVIDIVGTVKIKYDYRNVVLGADGCCCAVHYLKLLYENVVMRNNVVLHSVGELLAFSSAARSEAALSVEKNGFPVPQPKITTLPFSR